MSDHITKILKAISDPTRRELFHSLVIATAAMPITQVSANFQISRQGVTKHLRTLSDAGLVKFEKKGRETYCYADALPLKDAVGWINSYEQFWNKSLNNLGDFLDKKTIKPSDVSENQLDIFS